MVTKSSLGPQRRRISVSALKDAQIELKKISKACHTNYDTVAREFIKEYKTDFVQTSPDFKDDESRVRFCLSAMTIKFGDRLPVQPYDIIPIGFGSAKVGGQSNKPYCDLMVLIRNKIRRIQCTIPQIVDKISLDVEYKQILLSSFSKKVDSDLTMDDRAIFEQPHYLDNWDFDSVAKVDKVDITEAALYPSATDKNGYSLRNDWKVVEGVISQRSSGKSKNGGEWGMYRLKPEYGAIELADGKIGEAVQTWISPKLMKYEVTSKVRAYGPITLNDDNEPSINAYRIKPLIARPIEKE